MANVWLESERGDMFLPNEASIIAFDNGQRYNPRIFLCGIQKLRTMAGFANLKVDKIYSNQLSYSSLAWYIILGIFFYIRTFFTFRKIYNRASDITEKEILKEQYKVNNNMTVLLHKHLCVSFRKMVG